MQSLLLIDGNGIIHRAYHALPYFKTKAGVPTNALYGFLTMTYKVITDFKPDYVMVCFDTPKPTFRKELFKGYQAHRPKADDDLVAQFSYIREMLEKAGIVYYEKPGFEADDVIGTLAKTYEKEFKVLILSADKDILQLVDDQVTVIAPKTGISKIALYNVPEVVQKFGLQPDQIADLKALTGDPSDNYTGAKGIGPKTAMKLLLEYKTVENLLKNLASISDEKVKNLLTTYKDNVELSKKLSAIDVHVPIESDIEKAKFSGFKPELNDFLKNLEINNLRERIFNPPTERKVSAEKKPKTKTPPDQIDLF